jgi:DNA-binding MarR family transcriptional regulator
MASLPIPDDTVALRAWRDATLYRLLLRASRAERIETLARIHRRGHTDATLTFTNLLANLDTEGTTISALARRAGITRQAASQQIAEIERAGYVTRRPDPRDARATIVEQTTEGRQLLQDALESVADIEAEYARLLGADRLEIVKSALAALLEHTDPEGTLGRD